MTTALRHRGPDDHGMRIMNGGNARNLSQSTSIGMGHRRLSIIDLSTRGRQPMSNEDETIWLTFNGEIYNFQGIRQELVRCGHLFKSDTDTEVIIHGYEEYGEAIFEKLNGMFALGLWDANSQSLYLVRDRFGKKPLYYWERPDGIVYASELKSFICHPDFKKRIDLDNLIRYLFFEYVPSPHSIYEGVKKLLPGHFLRWRGKDVIIRPYWRMTFGTEKTLTQPLEETQEHLIYLLGESIKKRLISDVPLGVFLSGGIDSSAIVALMSEFMPAGQIKTFSIGFDDKSFDESEHARYVARLFGTDHHEQIFTSATMLDIMTEVWDFLDEPFADASILPTYILSKFTRQFVTVALGGDGGDELFAGYDPFVAHVAASYYGLLPEFVHAKVVVPFSRMLPVSTNNMSFDFRLKQFLKGFPYEPALTNQIWLGSFSDKEQFDILNPEIRPRLESFAPFLDIKDSCNGISFRDTTEQIIYLYTRFYLADDILTKVDRASMATSLEVRSPFLDVDFAEFTNGLPSGYKLKGCSRKYLLKKSLASRLPKGILRRKKKGFGIPLAKWFKKELKEQLLDTFHPARIKNDGFFDADAIWKLIHEHLEGRRDNRKKLWTLFVFQNWKERYAS
jgi:asparagine synthase (glutamine-hydrolysing)